MTDQAISLSKIVASPSGDSWSQTYSAGKVFAVISIKDKGARQDDEESLATVGKKIIDDFEAEYFTLEEKNLETISKALKKVRESSPEDISLSFICAIFIEDALYLFILGEGEIFIKRGGKIVPVLSSEDEKSFKSSSGFPQGKDIILLASRQFTQIITPEQLSSSFQAETPEEISEALAPLIHEKQEGSCSALILKYNMADEEVFSVPSETPAAEEEEASAADLSLEESPEEPRGKQPLPARLRNISFLSRASLLGRGGLIFGKTKLTKSRKRLLSVAALIIIVLAASIFLGNINQENQKSKAAFEEIYSEAEKYYEEGEGLMSLNQNLARDSFLKAQSTIEEGKADIKEGSDEEEKINELLAAISKRLDETSGASKITAREISKSESPLLAALIDEKDVKSTTQNNEKIYLAEPSRVISMDKSGDNKEEIDNDDMWEDASGIGVYLTNLYILDKKSSQVHKLVPSSQGYGSSNYFSSAPELSSALSLSVDTSVWILFKDRVEKYTRGNSDNFNISGMDKAFSNPTRIFTGVDVESVYVLDKGNSRIVMIDKNGNYKAQYVSDVIKNAQDFDVREDEDKIYVLSGGKIYELTTSTEQ